MSKRREIEIVQLPVSEARPPIPSSIIMNRGDRIFDTVNFPSDLMVAWQFTDETKNQVFNNVTCNRYSEFDADGVPILKIQSPHGDILIARFGDWVAKVADGEFYVIPQKVMDVIFMLRR